MLQMSEVTVRYGSSAPAVDGVSLTVADGEILALLGPSGCGKSTLLRAVVGLQPLSGGRIAWDGADLARVPVHRRGFGLMFQDGVLAPHRSVAGNVGYGLHGPAATRRIRVDQLLELVGLPGFGPRAVTELSGGQAQRVALARALAPRPRLLLLDEPLAALDREWRERLLEDLRAILVDTGTTAIFVTHDQNEAYTVADRIAVMKAGRIRQVAAGRTLWAAPADEWVAGFLGCRAVVDVADWRAAGGPDLAGDRIALRPAALTVDPAGTLSGSVHHVAADPDGFRLTVVVAGLGPIPARSAGPVEVGAVVRLRFVPEAVAIITPADLTLRAHARLQT